MVKAKRLIVDGQVQRVGYRDYIQLLGREICVKGHVKNDEEDPFKVEILVIYDTEEKYKTFLERAKNPPFPASVSSIVEEDAEVNEDEAKKYKTIRIIRGDPTLELAERLDQAMYFFRSLDKKQDSMLEKQDKMLEKQDKMLEKQDLMLEKQDKMLEKQDSMLEKQDKMLEKQDDTINAIKI